MPKPETAAQLARRERSQIRLRQKHLASKMWATTRSELSSLLTVKTLTGVTTDVYPRENCVVHTIATSP